jgi:hypothetical protein
LVNEQPVGGLEHEREGGRLLERDLVRQRVDVRLRDGHQLRMCAVHVLADHGDLLAVLDPGVDHDALAGVLAEARAVRAEDPRLRHEGRPLRIQRSRWLSDAARSRTRTSPGPGSGSGASS